MRRSRITSKPTEKLNGRSGILYVVSTPIGNLEDITFRALKTLKEADLIAAETVSHTKGLCRHYDIHTDVTSYNQHNRSKKGPELLRKLQSGYDVALVCNAGTPAVSDPGSFIIREAISVGIKIIPIPGPCALITALSISGLRTDEFVFLGFLSNKAGKRKKELKSLISESRTMVFYETPRRLIPLMKDIEEILGDRNIEIFRELTKIHEETIRGNVILVIKDLDGKEIKGEVTLFVAGNENIEAVKKFPEKELKERIKSLLLNENKGSREIAEQLSYEMGLPYRVIYKECIKIIKKIEHKNRVIE